MSERTPKIAVLPGDGIGVEVLLEGRKVLERVAEVFGHRFEFEEAPIGWAAIDAVGSALPDETVRLCRESDAIYFGAVGDPARDATLPPRERPEPLALLGLRKGLYANLRPAILSPALRDTCPLRPEIVKDGVDILIIRELTGGLYYGQPKGREEIEGGYRAVDTMVYTTPEIERIARVAFKAAQGRKNRLCSVDKANILACSQLWREVVARVGKEEFPDVELTHLYVDNCAMQLIRNPSSFDVILTENTFGDILSDEASMLAGSMGMLPSACLGDGDVTPFYEPIHGSAPDIAGKGIANPIAAILTAAMMLRHSFDMHTEADAIERAVSEVLAAGHRTADIVGPGGQPISTSEMGSQIADRIRA
ncbi:MAG: 3-isopropylmalate dehydrogenase [Armatimonadota bacterium]